MESGFSVASFGRHHLPHEGQQEDDTFESNARANYEQRRKHDGLYKIVKECANIRFSFSLFKLAIVRSAGRLFSRLNLATTPFSARHQRPS
jgi:hypothetical protein